jgi:hypothetical protein
MPTAASEIQSRSDQPWRNDLQEVGDRRRISRCLTASAAYRAHAASTRRREEAAADLGLEEATFDVWLVEARNMGFLATNE